MKKPIKGFEQYFASDDGEIYSTQLGGMRKLKKLKNPANPGGIQHRVAFCKNGKMFYRSVSSLILEAFVCPRPKGMWACHGANGRLDDSLKNLYWATPKQNTADRKRDGTEQVGSRNPNAKLNGLQVRIIRRSYGLGLAKNQLADVFNVSKSAIIHVIKKHTWNHV